MFETFFARRAKAVVFVALLLAPVAFGGARRALLSNRNDITEWLPSSFQETIDLRWFKEHFPGEEFILLSWEGCTLDDPRIEQLLSTLVAEGDVEPQGDQRLFDRALSGPRLVDTLVSEPIELPREEAINRLRGTLIGPDGQHTCAIVTLSPEGIADIAGSIAAVEHAAIEVCQIPDSELHMGGPPVDNNHIDVEGERMIIRLGFLASIVGLGLAWWCLRSWSLTFMVFFVALYSGALSLAMMKFTGVPVNAVVLTMPSLVYVLALSGAIHIVNYYRDALEHGDADTAPGRAIRAGWMPCTIAAATTSIGLASLCLSDITPINTFGMYSAIGVVASLFLILLVLPALLQLSPVDLRRPSTIDPAHAGSRWARVSEGLWQSIIARHGWVTVTCVLVLTGAAYGLTKMQTTVKLMKLFDADHRIIHDYRWLEEHLGELVPMEVVLRVDPARCQLNFLDRFDLTTEIQSELESIPEVASTLATPTFAPDLDAATETPQPRAGRLTGALGAALGLRGNRERIERNVRNKRLLGYRDEFLAGDFLSEGEGEELWRISARVGALTDLDYGQFVATIRQTIDPLIEKRRAEGIEGIEVTYTGIVPLVYKSQRTLLDNLFESFGTAFALIAVVMMIILRNPIAGLLAMLPNLFPAVFVFGMMCWLGVEVDIGSMMCASVALGVGVDDTVHYLTWFRRGLDRTGDRRKAILVAYDRCSTAMIQTSIIGGLGLAAFALSSFMPTQRFGVMMVTLLAAALIGDLVMLPAMLAGPFGRMFDRSGKRRKAAIEAPAEVDAAAVVDGQPISAPAPTAEQPETPAKDSREALTS